MYHIKTFNKISPVGLNKFDAEHYVVSDSETNEDGILVRSAKLLDYQFPDNLLAISRAGVGVNNIPIDRCSEAGIAVFSTPGANANAVKELVLCAMLMGSRDVSGAIDWVRDQVASGVDVTTVVEKGKSAFVGPELYKKSLGVIGLGANIALSMGMDVYGYDPYLSVDAALRLDRHIHVVKDVGELYKRADYITIHIHFTDKTKGMIDEKAIANMKRGVRFINLARGEIVDDDAMLAALGDAAAPYLEQRGAKWHVDLAGLNRHWLVKAGVLPEHIDTCGLCTACRPDLFWSHRKMGDARGVQAAIIAQ